MKTFPRRAPSTFSGLLLLLDGKGTLVDQLVRALRNEIKVANIGARLPPTRTLARDLGVSRNTVITAYEELANEGLVVSRFGGGSFISGMTQSGNDDPANERGAATVTSPAQHKTLSQFGRRLEQLNPSPILERPHLQFDFRYGLPIVGDFPFTAWSRIVARRATVSSVSLLGYGESAGYRPLRCEIAEYLRRARGINCDADQIIITNGSQQALDLIARVLIDPGDRVVLEEPQYEGAREAFSLAGARIVAVPVDQDGLQVGKLPARSSQCRAVYVTPSHQFPTGAVLSADRRRKLLEWARMQDCFIVEDDYDGELRYDIRPIEAIKGRDADDKVIYVGTMSKVLFPSLRLGYLVSPRPLIKSLVAAKHVCDRQTPMLLQSSLSDFLAQGHFNRHLVRARRLCARRRAALLRAIDEHLGTRVTVEGANAGIHVMMWLEGCVADEVPDLVAKASEVGVGIYPISPYFIHAPQRAGFLLGYASMEEDMIHEGIKRLAQIFAQAASGHLAPHIHPALDLPPASAYASKCDAI